MSACARPIDTDPEVLVSPCDCLIGASGTVKAGMLLVGLNPFRMFDSFPSRTLTLEMRIRIVMNKDEITALAKHEMNYFLPELLLQKEQMLELIEVLRNIGAPTVQAIMTGFNTDQHPMIWRCIGWMLKHGAAVIDK